MTITIVCLFACIFILWIQVARLEAKGKEDNPPKTDPRIGEVLCLIGQALNTSASQACKQTELLVSIEASLRVLSKVAALDQELKLNAASSARSSTNSID